MSLGGGPPWLRLGGAPSGPPARWPRENARTAARWPGLGPASLRPLLRVLGASRLCPGCMAAPYLVPLVSWSLARLASMTGPASAWLHRSWVPGRADHGRKAPARAGCCPGR